jgi:uncharacterized protein (DUF2249 family)
MENNTSDDFNIVKMKPDNLTITPKTKVGELLEAYPELQDTLISLSPAFEKLRNPVLRRTIARVASLQQIAAVGNIPLEVIINKLRQSVGQNLYSENMESTSMNETAPVWLKTENITRSLDAREMLEKGEHPMSIVLSTTQTMKSGDIYELITPFMPAPLVQKVSAQGLETFTKMFSVNEYHSYFYKP